MFVEILNNTDNFPIACKAPLPEQADDLLVSEQHTVDNQNY